MRTVLALGFGFVGGCVIGVFWVLAALRDDLREFYRDWRADQQRKERERT